MSGVDYPEFREGPMGKLLRLIVLIGLLGGVLIPAGVKAQGLLPSQRATASSQTAFGQLEKALEARGLLGSGMVAAPDKITPPYGVEVDETVQTSRTTGEVISRTRGWAERMGADRLQIEVTSFPSGQSQVEFWLLPHKKNGCVMFGRTMYDHVGRPLKVEFWRDDNDLKITGAEDFPPDLYPNAVPAVALPRVLNSLQAGAKGVINQQITPYGYVDLRVRVAGTELVDVPAGKFSATEVDSQPNVATLMPSWPSFLLHIVSPFIPRTTYYFQSQPPYRLLRKEQRGTPFVGGPEATTELVSYYIAGSTADASTKLKPKGAVTQ